MASNKPLTTKEITMSRFDHGTKERPVQLTDHERTVLMMALCQGDREHRALGRRLAYNDAWQGVFVEPENAAPLARGLNHQATAAE